MIFYDSVADHFDKDLFHIRNLQKQLQQDILVNCVSCFPFAEETLFGL